MKDEARARYTLEFKQEAVRLVRGGETISAAARTLGVSAQSLDNWVKAETAGRLRDVRGKALTTEQMEIARLKAELSRVRMERDILKKATVADSSCAGYRPDDEGWGRGSYPVINVSSEDAKAFAAWLSKEAGEDYRLLSEPEWEYAARAGTTTPFNTGNRITTEQANFNGNYTYAGSGKGVFRIRTVPVGWFTANAFGLHDMHGNVREWTEDCWKRGYSGATIDGSATKREYCRARVVRGGSWGNRPENLRSADRSRDDSVIRKNANGFRVGKTLTP